MFYFLISACQTVSVVNGHRERNRAQEEGERGRQRCFGIPEKRNGDAFARLCGRMVSQTKITHGIHLSAARCAGGLALITHPPLPSLTSTPASLSFDLCSSLSLILLGYQWIGGDVFLDAWFSLSPAF